MDEENPEKPYPAVESNSKQQTPLDTGTPAQRTPYEAGTPAQSASLDAAALAQDAFDADEPAQDALDAGEPAQDAPYDAEIPLQSMSFEAGAPDADIQDQRTVSDADMDGQKEILEPMEMPDEMAQDGKEAAAATEKEGQLPSTASKKLAGKLVSFMDTPSERGMPLRRIEIPLTDEVIYKPASRLIQDHIKPLSQRPCVCQMAGSSVRGAAGGSNRQTVELNRSNLLQYKYACSTPAQINPAATIPMKAKRWKTPSKLRAPKPVEEWKIREEKDKNRRDHELALDLGYETLVGNLLYIDIPGGKDINRSWQSFLSDDLLEWGFPYEKGTFERPRLKQAEPYLAHQVREKMWKYPRTRLFQAAQEDSAV